MSQRISIFEEQVALTDLIEKLGTNLAATTKDQAMKRIDENKEWVISAKYDAINLFVDDEARKAVELENQLRLPKTSIPEGYRLHLDARYIHTGSRGFTGDVEIDIKITQKTDYVMLHSKNLAIMELKVMNKEDRNEIAILDYHLHAPADTLTIYFLDEFNVNKEITVHMVYWTQMPTTGSGFYQTYYDIGTERRYLGATQFESTGARLAFPCYDEPGLKAVFDLKITHVSGFTAIANTFGSENVNVEDGTTTTTFETSPIMSTYLLAFVVSDLESIQNDPAEGETLHRIWVRPDSLDKAQYALENSVAALKKLEEYIGFKYELPKVDSAGVPRKSGAMENWGMVTYRENAMIYEVNYDDIPHDVKLSGVDVISHELAHQFFGDSVTCEWWDYIWLNEGFATLFEFQITDMIHPTWRTRNFFNIRKLHNAFRGDSRDTARAMTSPYLTPSEISAGFDYVVYDKSGSVLRMFQNAVGEDIFKAALKLYLQTNDHTGVTSQDLIDAFFTVIRDKGFTAFDFEKAFQSWELQAGYPVIHVNLTESRQFHITQERFLTQKTNQEPSTFYIPLNFATASDPNFEDTKITNYFVNDQTSWTISVSEQLEDNDWFVFNKQQLGYYRVNYDFANWHALILALNSDDYDKIHVLNRGQILDDALTFAAGDYLDYDTVFGLLSYLERETEYTPWYTADRFFSQLYTVFGPKNADLNDFVNKLTEKFYDHFKVPTDYSIPSEGVYDRYGREMAFKLACNAGNVQCLFDTYFQIHLDLDEEQDHSIPKGLEGVILCSGLRAGLTDKQDDWIKLWQKMTSTTDLRFKSLAISGLGCSDDQTVLKDYLESTVGSGESVTYSESDRRNVLSAVLNSYSGFNAVINFIRDFELDILDYYGYTLDELLLVPARTIRSREEQTIFINFIETLTHVESSTYAKLASTIEANLQAQQLSRNVMFINTIRKLLGRTVDDTTTTERITPPTPAPTTTPPTTPPTNPPTVPPTNPPTAPPTSPPTTPPQNEDSTTTTTLGASSVGIKLFTIITSLFLVFTMRY